MKQTWKNNLTYDDNDLFYELNMVNGETIYFDISNNFGLIPLAINHCRVTGFQPIRKGTYLLNSKPKKRKTLEELGFELTESYEDSYTYDGEYLSNKVTIFIDFQMRGRDFRNNLDIDDHWSYHCYYHEGISMTQELHKAVELKMIELGLWEE